MAATAQAQASLSAYNGAYLYVKSGSDQTRIEKSIDAATADLGFVQRNVARKRLGASTVPFPRFQVHFEGEHVLLRIGNREFSLPLNGSVHTAKGLTGDPVQVSATVTGHDLHQTFEGKQGTRYLEFVFHDDGTVSVHTRIESEHLPGRIDYVVTYRRAT